MSQGKKVVTVLDSASCQKKQVAVDEKRWNEIDIGLQKIFKLDWNHEYLLAADSTEGMAFLVSQLAYTEAESYAKDYTEAQYRMLIPVTSEAGPDASSVRYQIYDKVGQGERINGAADNLPGVDVAGAVVETAVSTGGISYQYTQDELVQAARMIRPLPSERMATAIEASERHLNEVALNGENTGVAGEVRYYGLLNQSGVTTHNDGTSGYTAAWGTTATADQVLADVNKGILTYWQGSNYTVLPNTLGLAPACYSALATRYNSLGTKTLLQLVQEGNMTTARSGEKLNVVPILQAATAGVAGSGATGKSRNVFYRNEKRRMVMHVPMPVRFLAPQPMGLKVKIPGWYKYAGLNVRYIYTVLYQDNMA